MTEKDIQEINNVINQYCLAIGSQIEKDFKNIFSKNKICYLISVGSVFEGVDSIYGGSTWVSSHETSIKPA